MSVAMTLVVMATSVVCVLSSLCSVDQFEAYDVMFSSVATDNKRLLTLERKFAHHDAKNRRLAYDLEKITEEGHERYKILVLYRGSKGKRYVIDLSTNKCRVSVEHKPFLVRCLPGDAKPAGNLYIGLQDAYSVSAFNFHRDGLNRNVVAHDLGDGTAVPVEETLYGISSNGEQVLQFQRFYNVTLGIKDESVFDIPNECQ